MIDGATFKAIMAAAPGPATVVTARGADGTPQGLTVSAVCSVSLDPPLVLACLDLNSHTLGAVRESGEFTINYLAHDCEAVALHFATKSTEKFSDRAWVEPESGVGGPILDAYAAAYAACRVQAMVPAGDHVVIVGEVLEGATRDERHALAYARRRFFTGRHLEVV